MNILITGGAGYIGSHVAKQICTYTDHNITILDNCSTGFESTVQKLQELFAGRITFIKADLSDWEMIDEIFRLNRFDAVIHFAASLVVPESVENPLKYYLNNTANTSNLVKICIKQGVNRFVFSSTAAVYGEPELLEDGIREEYETRPINPYGRSKLMSEWVLEDTAKAYKDFRYIALRYFNVAGADIFYENSKLAPRIGQSTKNATHLIKVAAETALGKREKMYIFGDDYPTPDGTCIRDYIHVDDLSNAHISALNYLSTNTNTHTIFNVGYGRGFSVKDVIETMKRVSGVNFAVEIADRRPGDPAILVSNSDKIKETIGWKAQFDDLELICKSALEWEKRL
ncbi:UDP-glucose 4-epimerase GalE [Nitrosophilus alvini]|uniref:UDP-glucose 4-epimerase GalE n=1 Tax=Nitrosophilus alvini TaxID=2714855 RepID=UPI00190DD5C7|nr:UDP-glucose 4-epimerase GalE [Nitrosophilus alvini]